VRVGQVNGQFIVNSFLCERLESTLKYHRCCYKSGVVMIESGASGVARIRLSCHRIRSYRDQEDLCAIEELVAKAGKAKRVVAPLEFDQEYFAAPSGQGGERLKDALDTKTHPKHGKLRAG